MASRYHINLVRDRVISRAGQDVRLTAFSVSAVLFCVALLATVYVYYNRNFEINTLRSKNKLVFEESKDKIVSDKQIQELKELNAAIDNNMKVFQATLSTSISWPDVLVALELAARNKGIVFKSISSSTDNLKTSVEYECECIGGTLNDINNFLQDLEKNPMISKAGTFGINTDSRKKKPGEPDVLRFSGKIVID